MLMLFFLLSITCFAQQSSVEIRGAIVEKGTGEPVEQATIRLYTQKDSTLIRGITSDAKGSFSMKDVKAGNYYLNISFLGFDPIFKPLRITGQKNIEDVGKLEMSDNGVLLQEAIVIGKAAEVVIRNDTMEYNADSYKVTEGSALEDLLKKMPGVEVGTDGKVTVNGKEVKKVMVDGKEFFSADPKVATKNLPAKMVDKVQVLDKKSDMTLMTGFDDGEEETVINLTVKPGMKEGWFGNAFAGYGSKDRYEGNAMVNRFVNNDQFTFLGGFNNTNNMGFSDLASTMFGGMSGGGRRGFRGGGTGNGITTSGNGGINFSKEFTPKLTVGGNARYSHSDNDAESNSSTQQFLPGDSTSYSQELSFANTKSDNIGANFRMEWKPDTLTQILFRPDFSYSKSSSREESNSMERYEVGDTINKSYATNYTEGEGYDLSGELEFSRKLNDRGRVFSASLSGGYSDSYNNENTYSSTEYFKTDSTELIDQRVRYDNNGFNYRAFVSWVEPLGKNNFLQATYSFSQRRQESLKNAYNADTEGIYNQLDTTYSKNYRNDFISQRIGLSFKAQREKYNYTIGLNMDPSYTKSENFIGDTILSSLSRNVFNLSPLFQFNYLFDKRTNLRINYNGRTSQPSMKQLLPVPDLSNPQNIIIGNPDLKPSYSNDLFIRFQKFVPEQQSAFFIMANGNYMVNDIVTTSVRDAETAKRLTTYTNVNGNYSGNIRMMFNTPLKNRKFTINSMTMTSYSNSNGFVNEEKNKSNNLTLSERAGIDFRSDYLDLGINGNIRYNNIQNTLNSQQDQATYNYGLGGTTTIYLPWNIKVESDLNYSTNSGYSDGYKQKEMLWNASVSKNFLKGNQGTLRVKIYDILQERSNISRSVGTDYITDSVYNTLTSYVMVHFIYRFTLFKGGATEGDMMRDGGSRRFGGGRGPGGPGGPF